MSSLTTLLEKLRALDEENKSTNYVSFDISLRVSEALPLLLEIVEKQREALEIIAKKQPHNVNQLEAADMAVEFLILAIATNTICDEIAARVK